ncbi:MAG: DnaA/Hda family protein [candidate division WOR-3 bacterium]|nr:DnaA/Hda family protein [candidate division WOR-3 bacterium]
MGKIIYGKFNAEVIKAIKRALTTNEVSPLFIYGSSGSGKTFLVREMEEEYKGKSALLEARNFNPTLLEDHKDNDLFILEDIQLLPERSPISETLFEIISYFIQNKKQIVFTANCHPSNLRLSERIISRIESGVIVSIKDFDTDSKRRVLKIIGKDLSPEIINRLQNKDIRTISQAIGAVKKARLLGYVSEEEIHEGKTENLEKIGGEFGKFIQEIKKDFPERMVISEEEERLRVAYRSRMFIWVMKGFNTERIKKIIDGPIDQLTREFVSYTNGIQRLIELQKRYGMLNIDKLRENSILSDEEIQEIEESLFNPDRIEWLDRRIDELEGEEGELIEVVKKRPEEGRDELTKKEISTMKMKNLLEELTIDLKDKSFKLLKEY